VINARKYFEKVFETYMAWSKKGGRNLQKTFVDSAKSGTTAPPPATTPSGKKIGGKKGIPVFTHGLFDTDHQLTSEPLRRSCLTGFELFFRHVALWEAEQAERLYIQDDVWASTTVRTIKLIIIRALIQPLA
jgi:hypothetical protein